MLANFAADIHFTHNDCQYCQSGWCGAAGYAASPGCKCLLAKHHVSSISVTLSAKGIVG